MTQRVPPNAACAMLEHGAKRRAMHSNTSTEFGQLPVRFRVHALPPNRLRVLSRAQINRRGAARWQAGHPWIFRSDVLETPSGPAGPVRVVSENRRFLGMALWSPLSQISLRMLTAGDQ